MTAVPIERQQVSHRFEAMASQVTVRLDLCTEPPEQVCADVERLFAEIHRSCTRFDAASPLMLANAAGTEWAPVPPVCLAVIREAYLAYRDTGGRFDPRVLDALRRLGYDRSFESLPAAIRSGAAGPYHAYGDWTPEFDDERGAVRIGPVPIDLGGIGKGLALRWAAERIRRTGDRFLVEAGGDCCLGRQADGSPWSVGVEDPVTPGADPVAVLALSDVGCATSSVRVRNWMVDGRPVHHLIDPATGRPADGGLLAVTVLDPDPARAEVLSKVLFLAGRDGIAAAAAAIPALWVAADGSLHTSPAIERCLRWRAR